MSLKNEFFIYMKNKPEWVEGLSFEKQTRDVQQFYLWELKKVREGVTVGGHKIHPWMYWHLNHWHIQQDIMLPDGQTERVNNPPILRDNEWFYNESIIRAEENPKKGLFIMGSRRLGKSVSISSWTMWNAQTKYGGEASANTIIGGSTEDLTALTTYMNHGYEYTHPMFKINRITKDWYSKQGVIFGTKLKNNETDVFSRIQVINLDMGSNTSNQKTAGGTPVSWVLDECGKFAFKKAWEAARPSFDTGLGTWRISPWLLGTSGNIDMVQDAMSLANNPESNNLLVMDWSLIERNNPDPTWTRKSWALFVPGQMSLAIKKVDSNLGEYLGEKDPELEKIKMQVTPWESANAELQNELKKLKKIDTVAYYNRRMFYPLDPDDCFLQDSYNPFPTAEAITHKNEIVARGDTGKPVDLHINNNNEIVYNMSDKEIAEFPHKGGNIDAPFILFEEPPAPNNRHIQQIYCAGLDHYKHDTSDGDSLGAFYIVKRRSNIFDTTKLVASYVSRPNTMELFNRNVEMLMKLYGAEVLQENADISFQQYLMRKHEADIWLMNGESLAKRFVNARSNQNNKYGITPNTRNIQYVFNLVVSYCWEVLSDKKNEDGISIPMLGISRIKDVALLDEIINYKKGQNHDRILAFGYALAWAQYLDDVGVEVGHPEIDLTDINRARKNLRNRIDSGSFYSTKRSGFY